MRQPTHNPKLDQEGAASSDSAVSQTLVPSAGDPAVSERGAITNLMRLQRRGSQKGAAPGEQRRKSGEMRSRELVSVCSDELMAEAIWVGPDQPLQFVVCRKDRAEIARRISFLGQDIVPPQDRNGLVSKGVVLLP